MARAFPDLDLLSAFQHSPTDSTFQANTFLRYLDEAVHLHTFTPLRMLFSPPGIPFPISLLHSTFFLAFSSNSSTATFLEKPTMTSYPRLAKAPLVYTLPAAFCLFFVALAPLKNFFPERNLCSKKTQEREITVIPPVTCFDILLEFFPFLMLGSWASSFTFVSTPKRVVGRSPARVEGSWLRTASLWSAWVA